MKCTRKIVREIRESQVSTSILAVSAIERLEALLKEAMDQIIILEGLLQAHSVFLSEVEKRVARLEEDLNARVGKKDV